ILNTKVRAPIEKALDKVVDWIVATAKSFLAKLFGKDKDKAKGPDARTEAEKLADLKKAMAEGQALLKQPGASPKAVKKALGAIKTKYKLTSLELVTDKSAGKQETDHLSGEINPKLASDPITFLLGMP